MPLWKGADACTFGCHVSKTTSVKGNRKFHELPSQERTEPSFVDLQVIRPVVRCHSRTFAPKKKLANAFHVAILWLTKRKAINWSWPKRTCTCKNEFVFFVLHWLDRGALSSFQIHSIEDFVRRWALHSSGTIVFVRPSGRVRSLRRPAGVICWNFSSEHRRGCLLLDAETLLEPPTGCSVKESSHCR